MASSRAPRRRGRDWVGSVTETIIIVAAIAYVVTGQFAVLLAWEVVAVAYLTVGGFLTWNAQTRDLDSERRAARKNRAWAWVLPVISSAAGANSAILALAARTDAERNLDSSLLAGAASIGVALSWMLLQVGFANMYRYISLEQDDDAIEFPGTSRPWLMDYLYFSFTIGASFATSDAQIRSPQLRRVATVHSVVGFFYNALVVAVAFQVLQQVIGS